MSDQTGRADDPLDMNLKEDAAHVDREDVRGVTVFTVRNENIYPKQATGITGTVKAGIMSADQPKVLVDLSPVQFMCSAFIGQLVDLHRLAEEKSGALKICVTGEHVAYTMKLVKLNNIIHIAGDKQQLLDSF